MSVISVCQWGCHMTTNHDALDPTVQGLSPPPLGRHHVGPPACYISWPSLVTCSDLLTHGHTWY